MPPVYHTLRAVAGCNEPSGFLAGSREVALRCAIVPGPFQRGLCFFAAALSALLACRPARAEEPALKAPVIASPEGTLKSGILLPPERADGLRVHWGARRDYLRDRDVRRAEDEEGRLRQLKEELALENLFAIGASLVRESEIARAQGSPALAKKRCELAVDLAPALPASHACLARALFAEQPTNVVPAAVQWWASARASWADPRSRRALVANAGGVALVGLLSAGALLVLLFFVRYARLYVHDLHHVFPQGARPWQTTALALALVLTPLLLQMGPLPLVFTAALAVALYLNAVEMGAALVVLGLFAAAPYAAQALASQAAFGGPSADVWLVEKGEGSTAALERLQRRLSVPRPEAAVAFTLGHRAKREGDLEGAEALYQRALELGGGPAMLAATYNNLGNVYLLLGDVPRATAHYTHAVELREATAAPHFNLARAHGMAGVDHLDRVQAEQARALEIDRAGVDEFTGGALQSNKRSNRVVMDLPLPDGAFDELLAAEQSSSTPVADDLRALMAGPAPVAQGELAPAVAAALCLVLHLLRAKVRPSGRCERCGREVCKRCDADARPNEALCAQCVNVFVRKGNVDATERIKKEDAVHRYQGRRRMLARVLSVISGASHVLLGYPVQGAIFLALTGLLGASLVLWPGVAHDPFAVRADISLFRVSLTVVGFVLVYALCLRDMAARRRTEGL
jgi:tetratricopeptide (TPR) repeat protein